MPQNIQENSANNVYKKKTLNPLGLQNKFTKNIVTKDIPKVGSTRFHEKVKVIKQTLVESRLVCLLYSHSLFLKNDSNFMEC